MAWATPSCSLERPTVQPRFVPASSTTGDHNGDVVGAQRIEALATGQTKLASEQARYEIAFRADLAALAEQIRRSSGR